MNELNSRHERIGGFSQLDEKLSGDGSLSVQEAANTVHLFSEIERQSILSQESLATRLGVAVGLTNAYIKRCMRKGLIKMQKVPARRYAYFLTPQGFAEKSRLTAEYLSHSFGFFRRARTQSHELLALAASRGWNRVMLVGDGELAEVAVLSAMELPGISLVGVVAPGRNTESYAGLRVYNDFQNAAGYDAVMVTDTVRPAQTYQFLRSMIADERILLAPLLHIVRPKDVQPQA